MRAEEFVEKYGGEVVAGDAIAMVNGKKQWCTRAGELTSYGLAIIADYDKIPEEVFPMLRPKKLRKQYMPEEP